MRCFILCFGNPKSSTRLKKKKKKRDQKQANTQGEATKEVDAGQSDLLKLELKLPPKAILKFTFHGST